VDALDVDAVPSDMSEMAVGPDSRVAVGTSNIFYFGAAPEPTTWSGYELVGGAWVDTGDWMGWVALFDTSGGPTWAYVQSVDGFFYFSSAFTESDPGVWVYSSGTEAAE
jgi:hypothetical protein